MTDKLSLSEILTDTWSLFWDAFTYNFWTGLAFLCTMVPTAGGSLLVALGICLVIVLVEELD